MTPRPATDFGIYAELDGTPDAPRRARELIRQGLGSDHPSADDSALAVSELVGNAVVHSRSGEPGGTLFLAIETAVGRGDVRIQVRDAGSHDAPAIHAHGPDSEHGRGLAIIAALAAEWGTQSTRTGRATWARIGGRQPAAAQSPVPEREAG